MGGRGSADRPRAFQTGGLRGDIQQHRNTSGTFVCQGAARARAMYKVEQSICSICGGGASVPALGDHGGPVEGNAQTKTIERILSTNPITEGKETR